MYTWMSGIARAGGIDTDPNRIRAAFGPAAGVAAQAAERTPEARPGSPRRVLRRSRGPFLPMLARLAADASGAQPVGAIENAVVRAAEALRAWHRRRRGIAELSALSDHTLKDIGVHRGEIHSTVTDMVEAERAERSRHRRQQVRARRTRPSVAYDAILRRQCG